MGDGIGAIKRESRGSLQRKFSGEWRERSLQFCYKKWINAARRSDAERNHGSAFWKADHGGQL